VPVREFIDRYPELLNGEADDVAGLYARLLKVLNSPTADWTDDDEARYANLDDTARSVVVIAQYEQARRRFRAVRLRLFGAGALTAAGVGLFAWASHPPT
jgi:hypothetical protein